MAVSRINEAGLNINQYGNRNLVINGAMQVAQRGTVSGLQTGYGACDRFKISGSGTAARFDASQSTDVPSAQGLSNSLKLDVSTADTSISAGDFAILSHFIEAQNLQQLKYGTSSAQKCTLSFWVKSSKTGIHVLEVTHNDASYNNPHQYTIASANTWQNVVITFDGYTSTAINNDNGKGLELNWWLVAGSTYSGGTYSENTWDNTNANRAVGQVNVGDSTSNDFYLTGVQLEVGDTATDFEHRSFADELQRCQRYCQVLDPGVAYAQYNFVGFCESSTKVKSTYSFPTIMRAAPTQTRSGNFLYDGATSNPTISSLYGSSITNYCCRSEDTVSSGNTGEGVLLINNNDATAKITFDAEL